jgi:hypothetical protein
MTAGRPVASHVAHIQRSVVARQFFFSLDSQYETPDLVHQCTPVGYLAVSADYRSVVCGDMNAFIVIIGHCFDLRAPEWSESDVAAHLLATSKQSGLPMMLAQTDSLGGRFAIVCFVGGH